MIKIYCDEYDHLLGNGLLKRVRISTKIVSVNTSNQQTEFPWKSILGITRRFCYSGYQRPKHEMFGVVANILSSRIYKGEFIREFERPPCGCGVEYLHRYPASRKRRRKGKSQIWDSKIWSQVPKGLGPEKDCAGKRQQHIKKTDSSSRQRGRPTRTRP
jgi:hypothetical protein